MSPSYIASLEGSSFHFELDCFGCQIDHQVDVSSELFGAFFRSSVNSCSAPIFNPKVTVFLNIEKIGLLLNYCRCIISQESSQRELALTSFILIFKGSFL